MQRLLSILTTLTLLVAPLSVLLCDNCVAFLSVPQAEGSPDGGSPDALHVKSLRQGPTPEEAGAHCADQPDVDQPNVDHTSRAETPADPRTGTSRSMASLLKPACCGEFGCSEQAIATTKPKLTRIRTVSANLDLIAGAQLHASETVNSSLSKQRQARLGYGPARGELRSLSIPILTCALLL